MSKLKEKSNFNYDAAKLLIERNLYAPSVHCSYYSCFQLLKYKLKDFGGKDYEKQNSEIAVFGSGSHEYVITNFCNEISRCVNRFEGQRFKRRIKELKQFRKESDYDNTEISLDKSNSAFELAKEIRTYLNDNC